MNRQIKIWRELKLRYKYGEGEGMQTGEMITSPNNTTVTHSGWNWNTYTSQHSVGCQVL